MSLIVNIPWDVSKIILTEWTHSVKLLGLLDIALGVSSCASFYRSILTLITYDEECDGGVDSWSFDNSALYAWLCSRQLHLRCLTISERFVEFFKANLLPLLPISRLERVRVPYSGKKIVRNLVVRIVNECGSIRSLSIGIPGVLEKIDFQHLQDLEIENHSIFSDDMENIRDKCSSLKSLVVRGSGEPNFEGHELYVEVVSKNPELTRLKVWARSSILKAVSRLCPLMEEIELFGQDGKSDLNDMVLAVASLPSLRRIVFNDVEYSQNDNERRILVTNRFLGSRLIMPLFAQLKLTSVRLPILVTPDMLYALAVACGPILTLLELGTTCFLSHIHLQHFFEQCPLLSDLTINTSSLCCLTDALSTLENNNCLKKLVLVGAIEIVSVRKLFSYCRKLEHCVFKTNAVDVKPIEVELVRMYAEGRITRCDIETPMFSVTFIGGKRMINPYEHLLIDGDAILNR